MADEAPSPGSSVPPIVSGGAPIPKEEPAASFKIGGDDLVTGSSIQLPNLEKRYQSGEATEGLTPTLGSWDKFKLSAQQALENGLGNTGLKYLQEATVGGQMIKATDANARFPDRPVKYTTDVKDSIVDMERNDYMRKQQMNEALTRGGGARFATFAGGLAGSLADPANLAVGMLSGDISELLTPAAAPFMAKTAAHFLANWGGFTATDAVQNLLDHQMGAKQKQFSEMAKDSVLPAGAMTAIGVGLSALARRFMTETGGTTENTRVGLSRAVTALEQDKKVPPMTDIVKTGEQRAAGITTPSGPGGEKVLPTVITSPVQEAKLYGASHADGTPLSHDHGLGKGLQLTDSVEKANNGVSRSTDQPGQLHETSLPEGAKLLDVDMPAKSEYAQEGSLLKAIEEKTGVPINMAEGQSVKDVITNLGDWAGAEHAKGKEVPLDILDQIQELAKEKGYKGYQFEQGGARVVHMLDTTGMPEPKTTMADPNITPTIPDGTQEAPNPATEKTQNPYYSPEIEKTIHELRKGKDFEPYSDEVLSDAQKDMADSKKALQEMAKPKAEGEKPNAEIKDMLDSLSKEDLKDKRLLDMAKRIADCAGGA